MVLSRKYPQKLYENYVPMKTKSSLIFPKMKICFKAPQFNPVDNYSILLFLALYPPNTSFPVIGKALFCMSTTFCCIN